MSHEHGGHNCYCPSCGYSLTVGAYVKCKSLRCPQCGDRMRATETGEYRVAEQPSGGIKVADQVASVIPIDNQAIDATWFGEARWLTDFITPDALEVQDLFSQITEGIENSRDRVLACWQWVASKIKYVRFVTGKTWIAGKTSVQNDLWLEPTTTIQVGKGNCAVKSFLLASLLRNELSADQVYVALGNLYNGSAGGHAWIKLVLDDGEYYMESTMPTAPPLVPTVAASRYEAVHYFNDDKVFAVEGKTQLVPFTACYSDWLSSYLHWAYIEGNRR